MPTTTPLPHTVPPLRSAFAVFGALTITLTFTLACLTWAGVLTNKNAIPLRLAEAGAGTSLFDLADLVGDAAILLLLAVAGVAFWRARKQINQMARLIAGLAGAVFAYGLSELLKLLIQQARPCASLPALAAVDCPPADDWSLPSNHAAIALALTSAILLTAPRLWPLAAPIAFVAMVSRVAAGEHYVHDVVDGAILGALTTITLVALLSLPVRALLRAIARVPMLAPIFFAGPRN